METGVDVSRESLEERHLPRQRLGFRDETVEVHTARSRTSLVVAAIPRGDVPSGFALAASKLAHSQSLDVTLERVAVDPIVIPQQSRRALVQANASTSWRAVHSAVGFVVTLK